MQASRTLRPLWIAAICLSLAACGGAGRGNALNPSAPNVASITPSAGFAPGGTAVTIRGTNLTGATAVLFGGTPATALTVVNATTIECTTPAGTAGPAAVRVVNASGTGEAPVFAYVAYPPTATDMDIDRALPAVAGEPPALCCEGPNVYVVWADQRSHATNSDVFLQRSTDSGATWLPTDMRMNRNAPGASTSLSPTVCCSGPNVYVTWLDDGDGSGGPVHMYFNSSSDRGAIFRASAVRVATGTPLTVHTEPRVCCEGTTLNVVWSDDRTTSGGQDMFFQRSTDGGTTWLPTDRRISSWAAGTNVNSGQPEMVCSGSNIYVSWSDARATGGGGGNDVWFTRSIDNGATWPATETRIDRDTGGNDAGVLRHAMCCDGARVAVAWLDNRNATAPGAMDVYLNYSSDAGASFATNDVRVNATSLDALAASGIGLCCEGTTVHAIWADQRTGAVNHLFYRRSSDGGATFGGVDQRLDPGAGALSGTPWMCCRQDVLHVTWTAANTSIDQLLNVSADGGSTWLATPLSMDTNQPSNGAVSANISYPAVCCDGARAYVAWRDDRGQTAPDSNIWLGRFN